MSENIREQSLSIVVRAGIISLAIIGFLAGYQGVFAATTTPAVPGNLIQNADMQFATLSSTTPDDWSPGGYDATTTYAYPVVGPLSGDKAAQVTVTGISDGAAEWFFNNVSVTGDATYAFSDWYNSNVTSYLIAEWTLNNGTLEYDSVATLASTNGSWVQTPQEVFTAPTDATSVTILHLLQDVGMLSTSNYAFIPYVSNDQNALSQGVVSLTFDDGWASQYDNALPILKAANFPASFYIITNIMKAASYDIFTDSNEGIDTATTSTGTTWSQIYIDPTDSIYRFADSYMSPATSTITVTYPLTASSTSSQTLTIPPSTNLGRTSFVFTLPTLTPGSGPITISHTGSMLTAEAPSLTEYSSGYMSSSQVLDLQAAGNEIGDHTADHCDLAELDKDPSLAMVVTAECVPALSVPTTAQTEITEAQTELASIGIVPDDTLAYPYGGYDSNVESLLASDGFQAARSVDIGYNTKLSDKFALKAESVDASTTLSDVESWINFANTNKLWLILVFHQIDDPATLVSNGEDGGTTPAILQSIISYLEDNNIPVETVHDALALLNSTPPPVVPSLPVATPVAGTYSDTQTVSIVSTNSTSIRYTLDGTLPSCSVGNLYSNPIAIASSTALQAIGCNDSASSAIANFVYTITPPVSTSTPPAPIEIDLSPTTFPDAIQNSFYSQTLTASTTATGPFTWSISSGALPDGLALDTSATNTMTTVSGTPIGTETSNFALTVTNGSASTTQNYTLNVDAPPSQTSSSGGGASVSTGGGGFTGFPVGLLIPNSTHILGLSDFNNLMINWGKQGVGIPGDFNGDGVVNLLDFNFLIVNWGK